MRQIQVEDDELLAHLAEDANGGQTVALLREGRPIAQIIPFGTRKSRADRMAALVELDALMEKGYDMGIVWNGRDELYDRDVD